MKLIALIDTERNIYHFSNKYKLNWKSTNIVEIIKQKNIPNFSYGQNIESLTCIVGPNGSGKTRFMNKVFNDLVDEKSKNEFVCQVYEESEKLLYLSNSNKKVKYEGREVSRYTATDECVLIKYSAAIDTNIETSKVENEKYFDISNTAKYFSDFLSKVSMDDMFAQVKFVNNTYDDLVKETDFIKLSNKKVIITTSQQGQAIFSNKKNILFNFKINGIVIDSLRKFINESKNDITKVLKLKLISIIMSISEDTDKWILYKKSLTVSKELSVENIFSGYLSYLQISEEDNIFKNGAFKKVLEFIKKFEKTEYKFSEEQDRSELANLLETIEDNNIANLSRAIKGKNILEELSSVIMFNWDSISSGEYGILNLFGRIDSLKITNKIKTVFLLIDEVDIGLHPEWQRRWASVVPKYLNSVLPEKKINLILSTHSPIVLSDIPKDNIILKKDSCTNIKETFGQNIHGLLTDSFFLENTIGEFSKKHIEELLIVTTPLHEQLYADVIKQQEDGYSRKSVKDNIEEYCKMHNDRFLKDDGKQTSKCIEDYISNIISIEKRYEKKFNDTKENYKKLRDEEQGKEELEQLKKENEENKKIIKEKQQDVLKIEFNKFIEKLNSDLVKIEIFKERATNYLSKNNLINNTGDEIELDMIIDLIERQIKAIGEEFYRGHLLRKLDKLDLQFRFSAKKIEGIEDILKKSSLTEKEKANLMDIIGGGSYDKINTSESK